MALAEGWVRSLEEFGEMPIAEFEMLMQHRKNRWHMYQCFPAGLVAAEVANSAGRSLKDGVYRSPFDYVPQAPEPRRVSKLKSEIFNLCMQKSVDRDKIVAFIVNRGSNEEEAESILQQMFPAWKKRTN